MNRLVSGSRSPHPRGPSSDKREMRTADGSSHPVVNAITKLIHTLQEEQRVLVEGNHENLASIISRKSYQTLELSRLSASLSGIVTERELDAHVDQLKSELARSHATLQRHMNAVRGVTELLDRIIASHSSDGTYNRKEFRPR